MATLSQQIRAVVDGSVRVIDESIGKMQVEVKKTIDKVDVLYLSNFGSAIAEFDRKVALLEGFSIRTEHIQAAVNEALRNEMSKSSIVTDEVIKYIKALTDRAAQANRAFDKPRVSSQ